MLGKILSILAALAKAFSWFTDWRAEGRGAEKQKEVELRHADELNNKAQAAVEKRRADDAASPDGVFNDDGFRRD